MAALRWKTCEALKIYARMGDAGYADMIEAAATATITSTQAPNIPDFDGALKAQAWIAAKPTIDAAANKADMDDSVLLEGESGDDNYKSDRWQRRRSPKLISSHPPRPWKGLGKAGRLPSAAVGVNTTAAELGLPGEEISRRQRMVERHTTGLDTVPSQRQTRSCRTAPLVARPLASLARRNEHHRPVVVRGTMGENHNLARGGRAACVS